MIGPLRALKASIEGRSPANLHLMYIYLYPTPHKLSKTALRPSFGAHHRAETFCPKSQSLRICFFPPPLLMHTTLTQCLRPALS